MSVTWTSPLCLKEWAVAVKALEEGKQIILLRKGGIREETKHFQLHDHRFLLYPTFEHQKKELIKPEFHTDLEHTLEILDPEQMEIRLLAEVIEDIEVFDEQKVQELTPYHIWTGQVADERLKWKRKQPLHVLILRTYKLSKPFTVPVLEEYKGCKSWHELAVDIEEAGYSPVLNDEEFSQRVSEIKKILVKK